MKKMYTEIGKKQKRRIGLQIGSFKGYRENKLLEADERR